MLSRAVLALVPMLGMSGHASTTADELRVAVTSVHSDAGTLGCALFNRADGFPFDERKAAQLVVVPITQGHAVCTFGSVPRGTYAIAVMHDENGNTRLDTNLFGIPKEGYGFSNNPRGHWFRPASFDEARFVHDGGSALVAITVTYR